MDAEPEAEGDGKIDTTKIDVPHKMVMKPMGLVFYTPKSFSFESGLTSARLEQLSVACHEYGFR